MLETLFAIELGVFGALFILYAVAALLGWKCARPRRWWNWEPAKVYYRRASPCYIVAGVESLEFSRLIFLNTWEPNLLLSLICLIVFIITIIFRYSDNDEFQEFAKSQGMFRSPNMLEKAISIAIACLVIVSTFCRKNPLLQGALLQIAALLLLISVGVNYFAPADPKT